MESSKTLVVPNKCNPSSALRNLANLWPLMSHHHIFSKRTEKLSFPRWCSKVGSISPAPPRVVAGAPRVAPHPVATCAATHGRSGCPRPSARVGHAGVLPGGVLGSWRHQCHLVGELWLEISKHSDIRLLLLYIYMYMCIYIYIIL